MALVCSSVYLSPDMEGMVVDVDKNSDNHSENVEDIGKLSTKKKLTMCNTELNNAQHKLRGQEKEIGSLCDRNKQLEKEGGVENESLDTLRAKELDAHDSEEIYYIERKNVCLQTSFANENAERSALYKNIDNLTEEKRSLNRKMNCKDIEIRQLRFRNKLLHDTLKESKLGKDMELCNVTYKQAFLKEQTAFCQEDTLIKDKELSKLRLELKRAQELKVHMTTDNCALNIKQREAELNPLNHTIETQLRHALKELEQSKWNIEHEREKAATTQKQMNKMFEENETLKLEISGKVKEIQQLNDYSKSFDTWKKEREAQMIGIMNDAKRQKVHLQEQLKQSCDEMALLRKNCSDLIYNNQQKDIQISEMKHEIERNMKLLQERESLFATTNDLLKKQFKDAGYELETCKQENKREKNLSNIEITKLRSEIKCLNLKINEKESELLKLGVEFAEQVELKEKEENKLRDIISKHFKQIKDQEKELEKRNVKIVVLEQVTKQNNQLKQALKKSHENEVAVCENIEELTFKLIEKDKHISELTQQLKIASESLENMKSEFENIEHSSEKKVDPERDHYQLEVTQEKEQLTTNKMQIVSTRKHKDCEMENEEPVKNRKETQHALVKSAETEGALRKTINDLQILRHSLKMQKKEAEERLRECKQEKEHEKEQLHIMKFQMCEEIEDLKKELTIKEAAFQEINSQYEDSLKLHEETEVKLNGIITDKDIQIQMFLEDIKKKDLENKETECQIAELKRQLKEITKASEQKESELGNMNSSLQLQHRTMETDMKKLTLDITHENELARTNKVLMEKMNAEIESLKLELMKKERHNKNLKDDNHRMKKEETKLNSIVNKQRDEIKNLKGEIEEKDIEVTHVDQSKELELFKKELNKLKEEELDLREMNQVLRTRNAEIENEVTVLENQLDEITKTSNQTENELRNINHSMKQEVKNAEIKLEQQQREISQEKQMTQTNHTHIEQLTKEIESLNLAMKEKDTTLQKYHERFKDANQRNEEAVLELNIIINKQNKEVQHLQGEIEKRDMKLASFNKVNKRSNQLQQAVNESHEKDSELGKTLNALQRGYQEKEDLVSNLNSQINEMSEAFNKRETELKIINRSLQTQLNTTKGELEQLHKDISHDKALVSTNQKHKVEMGKEIEKLKQDLEQKEIFLQKDKVQYNTCIKIMQEEELKLNAIIEEQKCIIQYLKEENKKKDMVVNSKEEIKKRNDQFQEALDALLVKEATLCKSNRVLEIKNIEKDEEVTELKKQLDDLRKTSNQKDTELRNSNISLKQQLNIKEKELRRKEEEHSNVKALISTKEKHEITMAEEIERIKVEVKLKEIVLQECNVKLKDALKVKEGTESNLKEIIIKQNEDINNLKAKIKMQNDQNVTIDEVENRRKQIQQSLDESHKKVAELGRTIDILQRRDKENKGQIRELKYQMNELSNTSKRNENQLLRMNTSLQTQLKNTISELKELHQGKLHEKESLSTYKKQMVGLNKEIESLQQEVKLKDARIREYDIQCKDALKTKQEAECKLKENINKQNNEIQHLQKQIEKKDIEANDIAAHIKMSEMDTRINDLTDKLKTKEDELQKGEENLSGIIDSQKEQIQHLEREVQKQERKMESVVKGKNNELDQMKNNVDELENQMKHMLSKLHDTDVELDETKSRLSRFMEDKLTDSNLNITDLSDRNRPTKIAEKCVEMYEHEWTYAFDVLKRFFRTDETAIEAFLLILQSTMHFCKTMARRQVEIIEREMYFADENEQIASSSSYIQKIIKDRRKATATDAVRNLKKIYMAELKKSKDEIMRAALDVEPYTLECIEICWLMLIQDPPVVFAPLPIKDSSFNSEFYKPYTKSGTHVDFAVWPALLLHDGGPILAKGVAQGYENK